MTSEGLAVVDVAVDLTEFAVCCAPAIKSIIRHRKHFAALHLVQYGYSALAELYPGWNKDMVDLKLPIIWHSELDPARLKTRAVVHLQPDHQLRDGALEALLQDMRDNHKWNSHFGVSSVAKLDTGRENLLGLPFYGFLLVLGVFDSLRSFYSGFRYHRTADLRGQTTYITFPNTVTLAPNRWWTWLCFTRVAVIQSGGSALQQIPAQKDAGVNFVLRTLKTHRHMGVGVWMFFFALYYALFAWPWWSTFFAHYRIPYISRMFAFVLERDPPLYWVFEVYFLGRKNVPLNVLAQIIQLLHLVMVGTISYLYFSFYSNGGTGLILLYPLYLAAFPLIYVFSYFYASGATWSKDD